MHQHRVCGNAANRDTSRRSAPNERGEQQTQTGCRNACKGRVKKRSENTLRFDKRLGGFSSVSLPEGSSLPRIIQRRTAITTSRAGSGCTSGDER